jgi:hypothetical protein
VNINHAPAVRQFIGDHPGCGAHEIIAHMGLPGTVVWSLLNSQCRLGLIVAGGKPGARTYDLGRPVKLCATPEERHLRRLIAQRKSQYKRRARLRAAREPAPRFVLPAVPEPPQNASCEAVETVEQFRQRCPEAYQVLPVNWPETLHYGRIPDRIHA